MTERTEPIAVDPTDPSARTDLRAVLTDYHDWLVNAAREAAATNAGIEVPENGGAEEAAAEDVDAIIETGATRQGFLVRVDGDPAGVALLFAVSERMAEIKRLYVRREFRGRGLGRTLCNATIEAARTEGYERIGLTTPPWSTSAHTIYEELGFEYTDPYPETSLPERFHEEALFMQRSLEA